jgi:hypothetical protein
LTFFIGTALTSAAIAHQPASQCLNCDTPVAANFCPSCGQETTLHVPSASEFLHEFVGHYVALEGKLWKTLVLLLFRPGRLTLEYLQGKRARYVLPLRLYLTFSLIFFAVFKYVGTEVHVTNNDKPRAEVQAKVAQARAKLDKAQADVAHDAAAPPVDRARVDGIGTMVDTLTSKEKLHQVKAAFYGYAPYAIFALMPVFALYLKLLYLRAGRRYGEHLLFALHANAFAFVMLSLLWVVPGFIPFVSGALWLWLVFYLPTAMRRVYGGSRLGTFGRWCVLMLLHLLSVSAAIVGIVWMAVKA